MGVLLLTETGPTILDGGNLQCDAGATGSCSGHVSRRRGRRWTAIGSIDLDSGTAYVAPGTVRHPSRTYEDVVASWGEIARSIPLPSGTPQAGQIISRLGDPGSPVDASRRWRDTFGSQTPQGRFYRVKWLQEGTSEQVADVLFTGSIERFGTGPAYLEVQAKASLLSWMDEPFAEVINQVNFPDFPNVKKQFLPLWIGHVVGKAVSIGIATGAPAEPPSGTLVDAADAADAITTQIAAVVFPSIGGPFDVFFIDAWFDLVQGPYSKAMSLILDEFNLQFDAGIIELADAVYARGKLQDLFDATDAKATEFAAISVGRAAVMAKFRSDVTAWFGELWSALLARIDAKIESLGGSPPSEAFAPQGAARLPEIGFAEGLGHWWGASMLPLWNVLGIYRKLPTDDSFQPVDPDEYEVLVQTKEYAEIPGQTFDSSFIVFPVEQPPGTLVSMDADGAYSRDAFGALPAVGYPFDGSIGPLRNPVDGLLLLKQCFFHKSGDADTWNVTALALLRAKFENGGALMPPLRMDSVTIESMTPRERMGLYNGSFQTDFFDDRNGLLKLLRVDDTDTERPVIAESAFLSFIENSPDDPCNRFRANYARDYSSQNWFELAIADNFEDQENFRRIAEKTVDLWDVRDALTAQAAVNDRLRYTALGSYRQMFAVALSYFSRNLELGRLIGLTHRRGMRVSGYRNREVKIIDYTISLDSRTVLLNTVVRSPLRFGVRHQETMDFNAGAEWNLEVQGPIYYPTEYSITSGFRGFFAEPEKAGDGDPDTFMSATITGTRGSTTYGKLFYFNFEPFSMDGVVSVDIIVDAQFLLHGNTGSVLIPIELFDGIELNEIVDSPLRVWPNSTGDYEGGLQAADIARTVKVLNIPAATWSGMTFPALRVVQWGSSFQNFSPEVEERLFLIGVRPRR